MSAVSLPPTITPGSKLGSYEVVAPLRAGGMATLWLGRRTGPAGFSRHVAIKVVHSHLAEDPSFVRMFLDEARLAARIQHANVVHTEELGEAGGTYYLAMEYIRGTSLGQFLQRLIAQKRGLAPELAVHIAMKVADGLHAAHEARDEHGKALGVVHRDVSPQNILLSYDGQVKLIDFGVAKSAAQSEETTGASLKGKIRYMSPEQAWGREIDRRTDVYALGIVLWECLTHMRLFAGGDDFAALERVRRPDVAPPSALAPSIPQALDHAVLAALAPDPAARFQTAQAFRRALGGACPKALTVEPEDLAALAVSVMEEDIEKERRTAPPALSPALEVRAPELARKTGAFKAFTREMPAMTLATIDAAMRTSGVPTRELGAVRGGTDGPAAESSGVKAAPSDGRATPALTGLGAAESPSVPPGGRPSQEPTSLDRPVAEALEPTPILSRPPPPGSRRRLVAATVGLLSFAALGAGGAWLAAEHYLGAGSPTESGHVTATLHVVPSAPPAVEAPAGASPVADVPASVPVDTLAVDTVPGGAAPVPGTPSAGRDVVAPTTTEEPAHRRVRTAAHGTDEPPTTADEPDDEAAATTAPSPPRVIADPWAAPTVRPTETPTTTSSERRPFLEAPPF